MSKLIGKTYANIHIAHLELKKSEDFVHLGPFDMVQVFSWNYSKFLDVVNYKQEQQFDIKVFWDFGNSFMANIHIIFEKLYENVNVLMLIGKLKKGHKYTYKTYNFFSYTSTMVIRDTLKLTWLHYSNLLLSDFQINFAVKPMSIILTLSNVYTLILIIFAKSKAEQRVLLVLLFS